MKRFRGTNPAYTKCPPRWLWPYIPAKKWGARRKRQRVAIEQANANIYRQVAVQLGHRYTVVSGSTSALPAFHIHWDKPPKPETQAAMAEVIVAATKHFSRERTVS